MWRDVRLFDAVDDFAAGRGISHALALTYGYDGDLAHERLWKPLVEKYGVQHPFVVADGGAAHPGSVLGVTVVRPARSGRGVFHPKLLLAVKEDAVLLVVGSANLTAGGLGGNLELVSALRFSRDRGSQAPKALLESALAFLENDVRTSLARRIAERTLGAFDAILRHARIAASAIANSDAAARVAFAHSGSGPLWDAILARRQDDPLEHLAVVSPFFEREDPEDDASGLLIPVLENRQLWATDAALPRVSLYVGEIANALGRPPVRAIRAFPRDIAVHRQLFSVEPRRLHGKMIVAIGRRTVTIFWGSANFTPSALLRRWTPGAGEGGNAECGLILSVARGDLEPSSLLQRYGFDSMFVRHDGELPELPPGELRELPAFDVGEVVYDPSARTIELRATVYHTEVRRLAVVAHGIGEHELFVAVTDAGAVVATWPAGFLEEIDPSTGCRRLRSHDAEVIAFDSNGRSLGTQTIRVNVHFDDALEVYDNLLLGPGVVSADALLVPTSLPPERRVDAIEAHLEQLRSIAAAGRPVVRHQASLDRFYRNVRRGLDARWRLLESQTGSKLALLRWSAELRRALDAATVEALDGPRRAFIVQRTSEHVDRVLDAIPGWHPEHAIGDVLGGNELARSLRKVALDDPSMEPILTELRDLRDRVARRLEACS